ncbi:MAG: alpha/beta hydrolase [Candidatus Moranbacteria bacterium]|nr:alpha/beta hydrolase [Candidatus Moranbacteria bacterium]
MIRETVIVVPGARYFTSSNRLVRGAITRLYAFLNVVPCASDSEEGWIRPLREYGYEVIRFQWTGDVSPLSVRRAVDDLTAMIRDVGNVSIISCSLGTQIALTASSRQPDHVELLVSLCGVYRHDGSRLPIMDVRSSNDGFGNSIYSILNVLVRTPTTTRTLSFDGIRHDEFADDMRIPSGFFAGRRISEVISSFIRDTEI